MTVLVRRIAHKEKPALYEFYHRTSARLYGVVLAIARERSLTEELLHDIYLKIWQRADAFDETRADVMGWIVGMARRRALDEVRTRQHLLSSGQNEVFAGIPPEVDALLAEPWASDDNRLLMDCLADIDPLRKDMLLLAYLYGMSHQALAEQFDLSTADIQIHVRNGLADLQRRLDAHGG